MSGWQTPSPSGTPVRHWAYASALAAGGQISVIPSGASPLAQADQHGECRVLWSDGFIQVTASPLRHLAPLHPDWLHLLANLHHHSAFAEPDPKETDADRASLRSILVLDIERGSLPAVPTLQDRPALHGHHTQELLRGEAQDQPDLPYVLVSHGGHHCFFQLNQEPPSQAWLDQRLTKALAQELRAIFGGGS